MNIPLIRRRHWALGVILFLTFICYLPVLQHQFLNWDDPKHLLDNTAVASFNLREIFTTTVSNVYVPLTLLSFAIEHHFFRFYPLVFHLNNLFLHLAVTALVYIFVRQLGLSTVTATVSACLFALHPAHVESVAWITERKDVLYAFFYLNAMIFYLKYQQHKRRRFYLLSLLAGFLSILAKPMALSLPLVLLSLDWLAAGRITRQNLVTKIPFLFFIIPIAGITYMHNTHTLSLDSNLGQGLLLFVWTVFFYVRQFFWPVDLTVIYTMPEPVAFNNPQYAAALVFFLAAIYFVYHFRANRIFVWTFIYYVCSMFFLFRYNKIPDLNFVADRFMYLPCLGFCILVGLFSKRKLFSLILLGMLVLTLMGVKTYQQTLVWRNSETFWTFIIENNPQLALAYNNRGRALLVEGRDEEALQDFSKALNLDPQFEEAYNNRGNLYYRQKKFNDALADFNAALAINPYFKESYNNIGNIYAVQNDFVRAIQYFNQVINIDRNDSDAYYNRATAFAFLGKYELALKDYSQVIALNDRYAAAYYNRSLIFKSQGKFALALQDALRAQKIGFNVSETYILELKNKDENNGDVHL
ncbi:MAG: tetratricopeptide repeat protein [Candidatus Omnitrophica bacterium]|nr:tetratricopeptide repeat protein [Candidatus Omnitrophota bacterium]